jgi:hypothetical protein
VLLAILVITLVLGAIRPGFNSEPMLLVLAPLTGILSTVHMNICAPAVRFIVEPFSLIDISVRVNESPSAVCHVVLPVAFIFAAVFPDLNSLTMAQTFLRPLTLVDRSIIELIWLSLDKLQTSILTGGRGISFIVKGTQFLLSGLGCGV